MPIHRGSGKRGTNVTTSDFDKLLEKARKIQMTPEQLDQQRRSFVWGNTNIENERITKAMIDKAVDAVGNQSSPHGK